MKQSQQLSFVKDNFRAKKIFGGALLHGRRKSLRPLTSKDSIHFVLRSLWAVGPNSFLVRGHRRQIERIITRFAKKFGVRIYRMAINSNHLHLLLRITNRRLYRSFIKAISGQIASHVMGQRSFLVFVRSQKELKAGDGSNRLKEGRSLKKKGTGFWEFRPFSRVVHWGRDFKKCVQYLKQNILEAFGFVAYQPRKNFYSAWIKKSVSEVETG